MIIILKPDSDKTSTEYTDLVAYLDTIYPISRFACMKRMGEQQRLTEFYLVGDTIPLDDAHIRNFPLVERVVRVSREYKVLGRHNEDVRASYFDYNGVRFGQDEFHLFAGLCAC